MHRRKQNKKTKHNMYGVQVKFFQIFSLLGGVAPLFHSGIPIILEMGIKTHLQQNKISKSISYRLFSQW